MGPARRPLRQPRQSDCPPARESTDSLARAGRSTFALAGRRSVQSASRRERRTVTRTEVPAARGGCNRRRAATIPRRSRSRPRLGRCRPHSKRLLFVFPTDNRSGRPASCVPQAVTGRAADRLDQVAACQARRLKRDDRDGCLPGVFSCRIGGPGSPRWPQPVQTPPLEDRPVPGPQSESRAQCPISDLREPTCDSICRTDCARVPGSAPPDLQNPLAR